MDSRIVADDGFESQAKIKVVGVGGGGGNAVNRMVRSGFTGVEFIAVNTDAKALERSQAEVRIPIGHKVTKGLGAGAKPDVGYAAIQEDRERVSEFLEGADMVFITAGMGGGTGTGAAPVVAEIAREMGILTVAVVTRPFEFEGPIRRNNCVAGIEALRRFVDTIIVVNNQKLMQLSSSKTSYKDAMNMADEVLANAVSGISGIILGHGDIQVDFADVRTIMQGGGDAIMGTGVADGDGRAVSAAERAIHSPLLDDVSIAGATHILVNITGGSDLGIQEIDEAMHYIYEAVGEESRPNIIFGTVVEQEYENRIAITVIATGFGKAGSLVEEAPLSHLVGKLPEEPMHKTPVVQPPQQDWRQTTPDAAPTIAFQPVSQPSVPQNSSQPVTSAYPPQHQASVRPQVAPQMAAAASAVVAEESKARPTQPLAQEFEWSAKGRAAAAYEDPSLDLRAQPVQEHVVAQAQPESPVVQERPQVQQPMALKPAVAPVEAPVVAQPKAQTMAGQVPPLAPEDQNAEFNQFAEQENQHSEDIEIPAFLRNLEF